MTYITGLSIFIAAVGALTTVVFWLAYRWRHRKTPAQPEPLGHRNDMEA